ncbi:3-hydroxyacyl-CoA dehydrogenase [Candidatus Marinamargulisbacteria bacterium SCGC AG-414-C22]|nr:3-hydroxyacyl-CoA dehydrogenase [Candidatus Marinamargulisbacteria bacterium SCGC AG-414-C22]
MITVVITGAASGLGAATATYLRSLHVNVVILDRDEDVGQKVAQQIGATFMTCDVTDDKHIQHVFSELARLAIPVRCLVNCAGVGLAQKVLSQQGVHAMNDYDHVLNVHLQGTFRCSRYAAELMANNEPLSPDHERGVIINTGSIAAFEGQKGQAAYAAAKGGIVAMTLPLARDLAQHHIRVNTICPGVFDTPFFEQIPAGIVAGLIDQSLFPKRLGKPEEFAAFVVHMIENVMFNACVCRLDAGLRM